MRAAMKVTTRLCPSTTTFLMKKESRSGIEPRPLCFKQAHKPSCRPPLVIPPDNSGKGAGLWMGADGSSGPASCTITLVEYRDAKTRGVVHRRNSPGASHQTQCPPWPRSPWCSALQDSGRTPGHGRKYLAAGCGKRSRGQTGPAGRRMPFKMAKTSAAMVTAGRLSTSLLAQPASACSSHSTASK